MTTTLLQTKLYRPQTRSDLVLRPRLIKKLNEGLDCRLILLSAPAGYGKSTLLSEWAEAVERPAAWLSLEEADNNPKRFFSYLISAVQQIDNSFGIQVLPALQASENPQLESILTELLNEITESSQVFLLILDDYHVIENQAVHDGIGFIIDHLPTQMVLVLAGRVDPPITLTRLRARGQMLEIRQKDLRFSEGEAAIYLNDEMGLNLTLEHVAALQKRTEGWITGLHLAALSLQGREDIDEFITTFSGSHRYIIDYLIDEVMSRQTEETQTFLRQTSILDRLCASLCDAVLNVGDSKKHLRYLEATNLFLISLDDDRHWYRYHHLFADFLNQRLHEKEPETVSELHRRTSRWMEQNDLLPEAVNHSLEGGDYERAAKLIESIGPEMMMQSEFDQLTTWLDAMPEDLVEHWPWLCIIRAWMYDRWAQFDKGESYLRHAEAALESDALSIDDEAEKIIRGQISAIRALYSLKTGDIPQSIENSKKALEYLPKDYFNRGVASFSLGWAKKAQGDLSGAIQAFEEGRRASLAAGNRILAQAIILETGNIQALQGRLHQAAETFREAIQFKYIKSQINIPYAGPACISLAEILRERNEVDAAWSCLQEGIEISIASKIVDAITVGYATQVLLCITQGDLEAANQAYDKAERMVKDTPDLEPLTLSKTLDSRVRLALARGNLTDAVRSVQESGLSVNDEIHYSSEFKQLVLVRVLIHSGRENSSTQDLSDAHKMLGIILEMSRQAGYTTHNIEALILQTLAFDAEGKQDQALTSLVDALDLAEPEGYIRIFVDEGKRMQALIRQVKPHGGSGEYVKKLLKSFEPDEPEGIKTPRQQLVDPLSKRELEVLRMLRTELTGPEIAQEMMVSLNTLRTHTKNIYSKLGVNNRRSAVHQAIELDLI